MSFHDPVLTSGRQPSVLEISWAVCMAVRALGKLGRIGCIRAFQRVSGLEIGPGELEERVVGKIGGAHEPQPGADGVRSL